MILYHATPERNLDSIKRNGLDPKRASGKVKGVWLHTESRKPWAILYIIKRHSLQSFADVALLKVNVPCSKLTRRWRGLWTTDTPITDFQVVDFGSVTESPVGT